MPQATFFNLPEEKRNRILEHATDEFYEKGYAKASISRIVQKSKIAKGSFYQYFDDKKDLYKYLIDVTGQKKAEYLLDYDQEFASKPFFEFMNALYVSGLQFAVEHPKMVTIISELMVIQDHELKKYVLGDNNAKGNDFIQNLLQGAHAKGELREGLDLDFTSHIMIAMNQAMAEYFYKAGDIKDSIDGYELLAEKMLDILKNGIYKEPEKRNE